MAYSDSELRPPKKPRKPKKPIKPTAYIKQNTLVMDCEDFEFESLSFVLDKCLEFYNEDVLIPGEEVETLTPELLDLFSISVYGGVYYKGEVLNKNYTRQLKSYEKKLERYKEKEKKYKEGLKEYKKKFSEYSRKLKEKVEKEEREILAELKKKYGEE